MSDKTHAIGLTWYIPKKCRRLSRKDVEPSLSPNLAALQESKKIAAVLPFSHKPLKESGNLWTDYWVIVLPLEVSPDKVWQEIRSSVTVSGLLRAEVLRVQPGMDMDYPHGVAKNQPVWHVVEYVVSKPERRSDYYEDQYKFSQPVITHFWENNAVERMIGFESERLLEDKGSLPKWDVIHITGFKPPRLIRIAWRLLRFLPTFNGYARKIGYGSALEVVHSWRKSVRNILLFPDRIMPIPRGVRQVAANNKGDVIYEPGLRTQGASRSLPAHVSGAVASTHPHPSRPPQLGCRFGALAGCQGILSPLYELT